MRSASRRWTRRPPSRRRSSAGSAGAERGGWELWRRCLTLPLTGLAAVLILTLGLSVLYFWLYETYALIDTNSQGRWYWTLHRMFYE